MKKYHYVYVTTNLANGKKYVGDHSTNILDDDYLGSGKIIKDSIKKYGKEKFTKEIIKLCETKKEAFDLQEKYINKFNTLIPNGYNISPKGGRGVRGWYQHSTETKEKIRKSNRGKKHPPLSEEHKKKLSDIGKGRKQTQEHITKKANSRRGKSFSEESKKRKSESMKGKVPWNKGMPASKESKEKNRQAHLGKKLSTEHKNKISESLKKTLNNR